MIVFVFEVMLIWIGLVRILTFDDLYKLNDDDIFN